MHQRDMVTLSNNLLGSITIICGHVYELIGDFSCVLAEGEAAVPVSASVSALAGAALSVPVAVPAGVSAVPLVVAELGAEAGAGVGLRLAVDALNSIARASTK